MAGLMLPLLSTPSSELLECLKSLFTSYGVTGQEEMASQCHREGLDWILEKNCSL